MQKWVMNYMKESLLFQIGMIHLLWVALSILDTIFHNPSTDYYVWNYFVLIERKVEGIEYKNQSLCEILYIVLIMVIVFFILHFIGIRNKGLIDLYVVLMSIIMFITIFQLLNCHETTCMFVAMVIELLYMVGLGTEISIDR